MTRTMGVMLIVPLLWCVPGCVQRAIQAEASDGAAPEASKEERGWSSRPTCQQQRAAEPVQCDQTCLKQKQCVLTTLPHSGGPQTERCVECLTDTHCRAYPFARGPRCDPVYLVCKCDTAADCGGCFPGGKCMGTGLASMGGAICGCATLGPSKNCPADAVCNGLSCVSPCRPQDCDSDTQCDQRLTSPTYGVCVFCLSDAECLQDAAKPICMALLGRCGCDEDSECTKNPSGAKCHRRCIHHPGIASCKSFCGCKTAADCPVGKTCNKHQCQ
jgi:hypothetical protein